ARLYAARVPPGDPDRELDRRVWGVLPAGPHEHRARVRQRLMALTAAMDSIGALARARHRRWRRLRARRSAHTPPHQPRRDRNAGRPRSNASSAGTPMEPRLYGDADCLTRPRDGGDPRVGAPNADRLARERGAPLPRDGPRARGVAR